VYNRQLLELSIKSINHHWWPSPFPVCLSRWSWISIPQWISDHSGRA